MSKADITLTGTVQRNFALSGTVKIDNDKIGRLSEETLAAGFSNFSLYQRCPHFSWPSWLKLKLSPDSGFLNPVVPPLLVNDTIRDTLPFSNLLSSEEFRIDPFGMLSPSYAGWSLEIWVRAGKILHIPSERTGQISQTRDIVSTVIETRWEEKNFTLCQRIFGAKSDVDEAVVTLDFTLKTGPEAMVYVCVRPYNQVSLGGLTEAKYSPGDGTVSINGKKIIYCPVKPDHSAAGTGDRDADLDLTEDALESTSSIGMAALSLGFLLKKGENRLHFRCSLDPGGLKPGKYDLDMVKKDFIEFGSMRVRQGASLGMPDRNLQNWFTACKMNSLLVQGADRFDGKARSGRLDFRDLYYAVQGLNRMGFFKESDSIAGIMTGLFPLNEKKPDFWTIIAGCYLLCSYSDIFTHTREVEYLQSRFSVIRQVAGLLLKASGAVKGILMAPMNSIPEYCIQEGHPCDTLLLSDALERFSYLARCLGLFGEEIKFRKESERLAGLFTGTMEKGGFLPDDIHFIFYLLHTVPHLQLPASITGRILDAVFSHYGEMPLNVKPYGWDVFNSLVVANSLILRKDPRAHQVLGKLMEIGGGRYSFPSFLNPASGRGCYGTGSSGVASMMLFICLRNIMFVDYTERLELFPIPHRDWFKPGAEIVVEAFPSRFGQIHFRMVSTSNEIQLHFESLPKFVPPDIMINLPVRATIHEADDFIVKREEEQSFVINGWPSVVRFIRK